MKILLVVFLLLISSCEKGDNSKWDNISQQPATDEAPGTPGPDLPDPTDETPQDMTMVEEFTELVNAHRVSIGLSPLIHHDELGAIAEAHSGDMASGAVAFGHAGFSERCSAARNALGGGNLCAENVAMGQKTVTAAFNAWMNSSGHRANIEQARATHMGFGYRKSSSGTYYWTQIFLELN